MHGRKGIAYDTFQGCAAGRRARGPVDIGGLRAAQRGQAAADAAGYGSAAAAFGRQQFCAEGRAGGYGAGS